MDGTFPIHSKTRFDIHAAFFIATFIGFFAIVDLKEIIWPQIIVLLIALGYGFGSRVLEELISRYAIDKYVNKESTKHIIRWVMIPMLLIIIPILALSFIDIKPTDSIGFFAMFVYSYLVILTSNSFLTSIILFRDMEKKLNQDNLIVKEFQKWILDKKSNVELNLAGIPNLIKEFKSSTYYRGMNPKDKLDITIYHVLQALSSLSRDGKVNFKLTAP